LKKACENRKGGEKYARNMFGELNSDECTCAEPIYTVRFNPYPGAINWFKRKRLDLKLK